jgi:hypothetical protein
MSLKNVCERSKAHSPIVVGEAAILLSIFIADDADDVLVDLRQSNYGLGKFFLRSSNGIEMNDIYKLD